MSVLKKIWKVVHEASELPLIEKLLKNRGLHAAEDQHRFLHPGPQDFHDPFLMRDMEKAVVRIQRAIQSKERIMIFGDYDLDGITGTAILMRALTSLQAQVSYRIPHRINDGYGLREKFVREFVQLKVGLIITVDNGISCKKEVAIAQELGIDTIVSDHHTLPAELPNAIAVLHPKLPNGGYPFDELTGSAVALKLAQALLQRHAKNHAEEIHKLLDLAAIGTIGDFGPLVGENRYIVKEGLKVLQHTRWPGLSRLKKLAGVKGMVDTYDIGFLVGPRLNAAGRMGDAADALKLLLYSDEQSGKIAEQLELLNRRRQNLTEALMPIVEEQAVRQKNDPVIVVHHRDLHAGIIGILAAKIVERYRRPGIVIEEREVSGVGSCRSIVGFNIVEALHAAREHLTHFGGHAQAAGFEVRREAISAFSKCVKEHGAHFSDAISAPGAITVDCELSPHEITMKTAELLEQMAPFGAGNERPRFLCKNVRVRDHRSIGKENKHLKMSVSLNGSGPIDCIGFGLGGFGKYLGEGQEIDLVCELEKNEWQGRTRLQLKVLDFKTVEG